MMIGAWGVFIHGYVCFGRCCMVRSDAISLIMFYIRSSARDRYMYQYSILYYQNMSRGDEADARDT